MLTDEEKELFKDWTNLDVELYLVPPFGRPISPEEQGQLDEIKEYIAGRGA